MRSGNRAASGGDHPCMLCQACRDALSAQLDGEDPGLDPAAIDHHLAGCEGCRSFAAGAGVLRRRLAVRPADAVPDLTGPILAAARSRETSAAAGGHWSRWALLGVALTQLALSVPPVLLGHDAGAPVHVARELGAWDLALAIALLLVAVRPARAPGLVPFAGALLAALALTAVVDVASGRATPVSESHHLLDVAGTALVWLIARRPVDPTDLLAGLRRPRPTLAA